MVGETKIGPLKRCPKCGHPEGLIRCPVCHGSIFEQPIIQIYKEGGVSSVNEYPSGEEQRAEKAQQENELSEAAREHRERTTTDEQTSQVPVEDQTQSQLLTDQPDQPVPSTHIPSDDPTEEKMDPSPDDVNDTSTSNND